MLREMVSGLVELAALGALLTFIAMVSHTAAAAGLV
jgi:hypothetical protein